MSARPTRRSVVAAAAAGLFASRAQGQVTESGRSSMESDLLLVNGRFTTLDRENPAPEAVAIKDGRFAAVGAERDLRALAGPATRVIDLKGRRVIPGLIDSHMHIIRGGLNFNMELRWDGMRSLSDAMRMLREQAARTPAPQWVRVVGGFTEHQFAEKRLPTLDEINAAAPDTPVFILHLYDRALLNAAALRAVGYGKDTPDFPGGEIQRDAQGNPTGLLVAKPNATIRRGVLLAREPGGRRLQQPGAAHPRLGREPGALHRHPGRGCPRLVAGARRRSRARLCGVRAGALHRRDRPREDRAFLRRGDAAALLGASRPDR